MSEPTSRHHYTWAEYLAFEETSNVKHEYLDGEIYGMAGGSPEHAALSVAVASALQAGLRGGPCRVYSSDLRIRVAATGLGTYPDVSVVCGELERDPENRDTVTNPALLVEVLSPSTEHYDRGEKLEHYQQIPALRAVLLVAQDERRIELRQRADDGSWQSVAAAGGGEIEIASLGCTVDLDQVYDGIVD